MLTKKLEKKLFLLENDTHLVVFGLHLHALHLVMPQAAMGCSAGRRANEQLIRSLLHSAAVVNSGTESREERHNHAA